MKYGVSRYSVLCENIISISIYWIIQLLIKGSSTHMYILICYLFKTVNKVGMNYPCLVLLKASENPSVCICMYGHGVCGVRKPYQGVSSLLPPSHGFWGFELRLPGLPDKHLLSLSHASSLYLFIYLTKFWFFCLYFAVFEYTALTYT